MTVLAGFLPTPFDYQPDVGQLWIGIGLMFIPLIIFAMVLPKLKVGFMATSWQLPKNTFACSRPLLRLIGSCLVGNSIGTAILAGVVGGLYLPATAIMLPTTVAYIYSAHQRLQRHPMSEFAMPLQLPYPFGRPMRRSKLRWPIGG